MTDAARIHATAIVEPHVTIGERTAIWDGVHVRGPSSIGCDCIVGEKTYVAYGVTIGDGVKVNAHVYICTGVVIEAHAMIAAGVLFTNDLHPRAFDDDGALRPSGPTADTRHSTVRTGATIGAGAIIGPGVEIGEYAMVGMGAIVTRDVPPYALVMGTPARVRGWVCACGRPFAGKVTRPSPTVRCRSCGRSLPSVVPTARAVG